MSILLKHILRNIRKNLFSGLLIVISLALSTAVVYSNLNINRDMLAISQEIFSGFFHGYDIRVRAPENGRLNPNEDCFADADPLPLCEEDGECPDLKGASAVCISSDWDAAAQYGVVSVSRGTAPQNAHEVGITAKKAAYYHLEPGDPITVSFSGEKREYTVSCIYDSIGMFANESRDHIELLRYFGAADGAESVLLNVKADVESAENALREAHPEWEVEMLHGAGDTNGQVKSIRRILYMMLALTVIMGYYVISSVTTLMLDSRLPVIGTFRSIGASHRKMDRLLLTENAVYGIFGGLLGVLLGELLRYLLARLYYHAGDAQRAFDPGYVALSIGFAVLLQTGITWVTLLRAGKPSIRETIFRTSAVAAEISPRAGKIGAGLLGCGAVLHLTNRVCEFYRNVAALVLIIVGSALLIPLLLQWISRIFAEIAHSRGHGPLYLAFRNLAASKINISSVILSAMVIALALVISLCTASVDGFFAAYQNNYPYDIFIKSLSHPEEDYAFFAEQSGVERTTAEYWAYTRTEVNGKRTRVCFVECGGYSNGIRILSGEEATLPNGHVIVDRLFAARNHLRVGDRVEFASPDNENAIFYVVIDGLCDSGIFNSKRTSVLLTPHDYEDYIARSPALIGITLHPDADLDAVMEDLSVAAFGELGEEVSVHSKEAYVSRELGEAQGALSILSVVPLLAAILAVLGLVNNQIIAYQRKRREYAVLYSVAMSRRQLGRMVFEELTLVFLTGTFCGILLSLWLIRIVRDIVFGLIAYIGIHFDLLQILQTLLGAFALLCVSALIPRAMVAKMNVIEEIKYD